MKPKIGKGKYTQSTFDCDFYKINMQWAYVTLFPDSRCCFEYTLRSDVPWPKNFGAALQYLFSQYGQLTAPEGMEEYLLKNATHLPLAAIDYLCSFRFNPSEVQIYQDDQKNELRIKACGPTASAMRWEIPVLSSVSELYHEMTGNGIDTINIEKVATIAAEKGAHLQLGAIPHVDFGTRRRHSFKVHDAVVGSLSRTIGNSFIGTSNMHLALKHNLKMIGTTGHEWHQFHAGVYGYKMANHRAMENWQYVYKGQMGIVLPDTFTTEKFIPDFDSDFARRYDGARQDSGDWRAWTDLFYNRYKELNIDPSSKQFVYSDGINNHELCKEIRDYAKSLKIPFSLGIGTWFTCDVPGVKALNQVMKMTSMSKTRNGEWHDTIKIADGVGKEIGNPEEVKLAKMTLKIPQTQEVLA
jgi:nicotinate phosphoribosyltransferase